MICWRVLQQQLTLIEHTRVLENSSEHKCTRKIVTSSAVIALLTYSIIGNGGVKNFQQLWIFWVSHSLLGLVVYYTHIKSQISFQKQSVLKSRSEGKTWPEQPSTYSFHSVHCVHCLLHILCPLCPFLSVAIAVFEKCAKMWFMRVVKTEKFEHAIDLSPG